MRAAGTFSGNCRFMLKACKREAHGIDLTCATQAGSGKADHEADPVRTKTGKPHEVTIWFVLDCDRLYTCTANVNRQWVRTKTMNISIYCQYRGDEIIEADFTT
jgi:hypothetical protein